MQTSNRKHTRRSSASFLFVAIAFLVSVGHAQQINVGSGELFQGDEVFNSEFIKAHLIRQIVASVMLKKSNLPPAETGKRISYSFDEFGRITQLKEWFANGLRSHENITTTFTYNEFGLKSKRIEQPNNSTFTFFNYNKNGEVISETTIKKTPYFTTEKVTYLSYYWYDDKHLNVVSENDDHRKVSEETRNFDSNGLLLEISKRFEIGNMRSHKGFVYNENLQLTHLIHTLKNYEEIKTYRYTYTWEDENQPREERIYAGERLLTRKEFLYKNGLLDAQLIKDESSENIEIIEYRYLLFSN